jgi:pyrroline-5-carboxylate reductase
MATALVGGLIAQGFPREDLAVADVSPEARARIVDQFGVRADADPAAAARDAQCVVFAVKPQQLRAVAEGLAGTVAPALVVTIAAGIRMADLGRWLGGHGRIVRVMPNTPALVRAGISAAVAAPAVGADDRAMVDRLLAAAGRVLWIEREELMDAVTAVSGSGPAYVFYLLEAMEQAALELGFDARAARLLSLETVLGAARLAAADDTDPAVLRARVTSRGGTTERAIGVLEAAGVRQHFVDAIKAAAERSRELGDALGAA